MDMKEAYKIVSTWAKIGFGVDGNYTINLKDFDEALNMLDKFIEENCDEHIRKSI